jgi:hypothetical protein
MPLIGLEPSTPSLRQTGIVRIESVPRNMIAPKTRSKAPTNSPYGKTYETISELAAASRRFAS